MTVSEEYIQLNNLYFWKQRLWIFSFHLNVEKILGNVQMLCDYLQG